MPYSHLGFIYFEAPLGFSAECLLKEEVIHCVGLGSLCGIYASSVKNKQKQLLFILRPLSKFEGPSKF